MRQLLYRDTTGWIGSLGLLIVRVVMGAAFVLHGWPKIQDPFGWMGPDATTPGILAALAAVAEFVGGLILIPGLLTVPAAVGIAGVMVGAMVTVHGPLGHPFVSRTGGPSHELAAIYLACSILLLMMGAGRFSLDAILLGRPQNISSTGD